MPAELPIACSLTPAELPARVAEMRAVGRRSLLSAEHTDDGAVLSLRRDAETRARVEALVRAESECCPFLDFELGERGDALVLTIRSPADGRAVVDGLVAAFEEA